MDPTPATGLALLVSVLGDIWDEISALVTTIGGNAILLIPLAGALASLVIGLTLKLMGIRRKRG